MDLAKVKTQPTLSIFVHTFVSFMALVSGMIIATPAYAGSWGPLKSWPIIAIHSAVLDDGRVFTFGGDEDGLANGRRYYDIYDPATDTHTTYDNLTEVDMFCSAMVPLPGSNKVLISGGDELPPGGISTPKPERGGSAYTTWRGARDVNFLNMQSGQLTNASQQKMQYGRWYPTLVSLPSGQLLVMGGIGPTGADQITVPEIYSYGKGWRSLTGATDNYMQRGWNYPRAFALPSGNIIYFHARATGNQGTQFRVMRLNPTGSGSLQQIATLPFVMDATKPTTVFAPGKALVQAQAGDLWVMDFLNEAPSFTKVASLPTRRNWSNMTVLADGTVLINGGSSNENLEVGAQKSAIIWNPADNSLTTRESEVSPRLYHSTSILLTDGSLMTSGGGAAGFAENSYLDTQIYRPDYLFNSSGNAASRPSITNAPARVNTGQSIRVGVDAANAISRVTFVKTNAVTHGVHMSSGFFQLDFSVKSSNEIEVNVPTIFEGMDPGNWMMFTWNGSGNPSVASIIRVNPVLSGSSASNLLLNGDFEVGGVGSRVDPLGWTVSGTGGRHESAQRASSGVGLYAIDGWGSSQDGSISQEIATIPGNEYTLSFDVTRGYGTGAPVLRVQAVNDSQNSLTTTVNVGDRNRHTFTFQASSASTIVRFSDVTPGNAPDYDIDLDNVVMTESDAPTPPPTTGTNIVLNGSFEQGSVGSGVAPTNWNISGTGGRYVNATRASDGTGLYAMDGWGQGQDGVISQTVSTIIGQSYSLSFDVRRGYGSGTPVLRVQAVNGSQNSLSTTVNVGDRNRHTFTLQASSTSTTIRFSDVTPNSASDYDIDLDNVVMIESQAPTPPPTPGSTVVLNGSFEQGSVGSGVAPTNWSISGTGGRHTSATRASHGTGYYAMDGWGRGQDGVISQTVPTSIGQTYTLSFDVGRGYGSGTPVLRVQALSGSQSSLSTTVNVGSRNSHTFTFQASSASTTIRFSDVTPSASSDYDIDLDNVSVVN